jgi:catecholate siderophore receptor
VKGWELSLAGQITPDWHVTAGYSFQDGEIRNSTQAAPAGRQLDKMPHHQASLWTRYDLPAVRGVGLVGLGLGVVHQSSQFASISNQVTLPAFTRVDAALFLDLSERVALQLNVENLFDTTYYPSAHTDTNIAPGQPRNARLTARVKF